MTLIKRILASSEINHLNSRISLVRQGNQDYVLRKLGGENPNKYIEINKHLKEKRLVPQLIDREGDLLLYEYIRGRDLRFSEEPEIFNQVGLILAYINSIPIENYILFRKRFEEGFKKQLSNLEDKGINHQDVLRVHELYNYLMEKTNHKISYDASDVVPSNFRLDHNNKVIFVDIEGIRPRIEGYGISKFLHKWATKRTDLSYLKEGYKMVKRWPYGSEEKNLVDLGYFVNRANFKLKNDRDPQKEITAIKKIIESY